MELFSSKKLAYSLFFGIPIAIGLLSLVFNTITIGYIDFLHFIRYLVFFLLLSGFGTLFSILFYSKKSPILRVPPNGWAIQINAFLCAVMGLTYLFGKILVIFLRNAIYLEIFFTLGTILSYIVAFVVYFSFTTVGRPGYLILALVQPVSAVILYSVYKYIWYYPLANAIALALFFFIPI